jgi:transcriptional regulator of acetoin/glycerol metabolism
VNASVPVYEMGSGENGQCRLHYLQGCKRRANSLFLAKKVGKLCYESIEAEREAMAEDLTFYRGNIQRASAKLGICRNTLYKKTREYNLG